MTNRYNRFFVWGLLGVGTLLIARRVHGAWLGRSTFLTDGVAEKLPVAKDLDTIPDQVGNYDMDGVSFDTEGVIVSGDNSKPVVAPI